MVVGLFGGTKPLRTDLRPQRSSDHVTGRASPLVRLCDEGTLPSSRETDGTSSALHVGNKPTSTHQLRKSPGKEMGKRKGSLVAVEIETSLFHSPLLHILVNHILEAHGLRRLLAFLLRTRRAPAVCRGPRNACGAPWAAKRVACRGPRVSVRVALRPPWPHRWVWDANTTARRVSLSPGPSRWLCLGGR